MAMVIARWTTPTISYKPSQAEMNEVENIALVVSQGGQPVIERWKDTAGLDEDLGFIWLLTQEETAKLSAGKTANLKIDYLTIAGSRYTTGKLQLDVVESAVNEVIE